MVRALDFFFFYGSLYTYIAVMRIDELAAAAGVAVRWRPFNLRAIMIEQSNIPAKNPVKMRYTWRDLERRTARYGIPFRASPPYPIDPDLLVNRVGFVAAQEGWCPDFTKAIYPAWLSDHKPPHDPEHLAATLRSLGKDPQTVLAGANSEEIRQKYEAETAAARELGIFGAPTFAVGTEIFWGGDRLDEAIETARRA